MHVGQQISGQMSVSEAVEGAEYICWSRMQAEAGQKLEAILQRKECERLAGHGLFFWGVGNAPAVQINALALGSRPVPAVFSVMKTRPKAIDSSPSRTVVWRHYINQCGEERPLPDGALVTSRGDSTSGAKRRHYALICRSDTPLRLVDSGAFDPLAFRNASEAGGPVGASQVTALLRRKEASASVSSYRINLVAWLADAYWVRLTDPIELSTSKICRLASMLPQSTLEWVELVASLRDGQPQHFAGREQQGILL